MNTNTQTQILTADEAKSLIARVGPSLGYDHTYSPVFPDGRQDVCAVNHMAENGNDYGYDTAYLVWKELDGSIHHREINNTKYTKDYIHIESVTVADDGGVRVSFGSGGSFSGVPWSKSMQLAIKEGVVKNNTPESFTGQAKQVMIKVVEEHKAWNEIYQATTITEHVIDETRRLVVWILFEQIDADHSTKDAEGWLGDQFRYSLWIKQGDVEPVQLYEDHAYIRPRSKSAFTGTQGRDCTLKNVRIGEGVIVVSHTVAEKVEDPEEWEELRFEVS